MKHLIVCREYPPFPYPPGGIATYVEQLSRLLVDRGETVHLIAQLWPGAPLERETWHEGRLVIHRVPLDVPLPGAPAEDEETLRTLTESAAPVQAFAWQIARLVPALVETEAVDIIEAQKYEAPLFYLLRQQPRGTALRRVPMIVHLHSPSEFLFRHNDWPMEEGEYALITRLEEYTIRAADALLCPSRFLATIAEEHYGLDAGSVTVLPYPVGDLAHVPRAPETWRSGTVCYVGRLEARKGVYEWIDAVIAVGAADSALRVTLIGGDPVAWGTGATSIRDRLRAHVPTTMRHRVDFVGAIPRGQLPAHLREARFVVVPSRWENFPNTCIEAMASGVPVLASPTGGMVEMIEDGRTGWIAGGSDAASLAVALRRALATPADVLAEMGRAAANSIHEICDNARTVQRHLEFRRSVAGRPAGVAADNAVGSSAARALLETLVREIDHVAATMPHVRQQPAHTMTPLDVLRAGPRQQLAALRRAARDPGYVVKWLAWHGRRLLARRRRARR